MKKQPRCWFRILTAIGIASLMIVGILAIQTFSIIRPRCVDQTLSMRCVGACPSEFMDLHLQGNVDQFHQFNGFLQVGELEIKLENRNMMPASLFFKQRISVLGIENLPLRAGFEICRQPSDNPVVYL